MVSSLKLVKSEPFGAVNCDFYSNGKDYFMTREQIGQSLEYTDPMVAIGKIHDRHKARLDKFSFTKLVNGRKTYYYNRKGIMEICRWSQQPGADAFMDWVWEIMDGLMSGNIKATKNIQDNDLVKRELAAAKLNNSRARAAKMLLQIADSVDSTEFKQVLQAHATKEITGQFLLPLPEAPKDYSADDIGARFGVSSKAIGIIANANNLKQPAYGHKVYDVTKQGMQVPTWRYFESVIPEFARLTDVWKAEHGKHTRKIVPLNPPKSSKETGARA